MMEQPNAQSPPPDAQSPLWRFSLGFYARPAVCTACLALQETGGADVNVLLFLLWLAGARRMLDAAQLDLALRATRDWQTGVIAVLRDLRLHMKEHSFGVSLYGADAVREHVKAVELEAERLEQEKLYAFAAEPGFACGSASVEDAANGNLALYETALAGSFSPDAVNALVQALLEAQVS
jgi:uncharacterized protein (TIGR02444 family)